MHSNSNTTMRSVEPAKDTRYVADGIFVQVGSSQVFLDGYEIVNEWLRNTADENLVNHAWSVMISADQRINKADEDASPTLFEATQNLIDVCEAVA